MTFIDPYLNNAINGYINPGAAAGTGTGGAGIPGVGPGDLRYAIVTPEQFFPVSGLMTFDDSVAIGRENLNSCVRGNGCEYNTSDLLNPAAPADPPVPGDEFVIFGYSQSAVIASLVKQGLDRQPRGSRPMPRSSLLANPMRPNGGFLSRGRGAGRSDTGRDLLAPLRRTVVTLASATPPWTSRLSTTGWVAMPPSASPICRPS